MFRFQQIRNACVKLYFDDFCFLIDPWLKDPADAKETEAAVREKRFLTTPTVPLPFTPETILKDVGACLVTHMHADHFSSDYLPPDLPLYFQNETDAEEARSLGFTDVSYFAGSPLPFADIQVYKVPARHGDTDELAEKAGPACGFVFIRENEPAVYLAGDTVWSKEPENVISSFRPQIIIVNACDAHTRSGRLIMNADDVMQTCEKAADAIVIASHMGAVSHAHLSREELQKRLAETPFCSRVLIPADGETLTF